MHEILIFQLLMLLAVANGTPVATKLLMGETLSQPVDGGTMFNDGYPLFGSSKTWRGVLLAVLTTTAASVVLGLGWQVGALVGAAAMVGDLFSSFVKRRLGLPPSSMAVGLDQIPESLFPLLAAALLVPLNGLDILFATASFLVGSLVLSRILFKFNLRDRPY